MPSYNVLVCRLTHTYVDVEADTPEDAKAQVQEALDEQVLTRRFNTEFKLVDQLVSVKPKEEHVRT